MIPWHGEWPENALFGAALLPGMSAAVEELTASIELPINKQSTRGFGGNRTEHYWMIPWHGEWPENALFGAALLPGMSAAMEELTASIELRINKHSTRGFDAATGLSIIG